MTTLTGSSTLHVPRHFYRRRRIQSQREIAVGQKICIHGAGNIETLARVTKGPYRENGQIFIDFVPLKRASEGSERILLEDCSVVRDGEGNWSECWLEKI